MFGSAPGVIRTTVGFTGGTKVDPSYHSLGNHTETVSIDYDPQSTSYEDLLSLFWNNHDPSPRNGVCPNVPGNDPTRQYMSVIFYHNEDQKLLANQSLKMATKGGMQKIATVIVPAQKFYNAENYHQKYVLRQHPKLISILELDDMTSGHVSTRLNGYLSGYGKAEHFELEWKDLGLSTDAAEYVKDHMKTARRTWWGQVKYSTSKRADLG